MRRATAGGFVYRDLEGRVIRDAAQLTRNTPAVCRKCYIHPAVLDGYLDGSLRRTLAAVGEEDEPKEMWRIERIVMRFLAERQRAAGPG